MSTRPFSLRVTLAAALLVALNGCASVPKLIDQAAGEQGPYYAPSNYRGEGRLPADVQRVAILPVYGGDVTEPEAIAALDAVLLKALQDQTRFEVVVLSREECRRMFGADAYASVGALPHGFLDKLAQRLAVDAVLFTDLTVYRGYRPLTLGFRAKLAGVRDVRLIWAFDEVFSADDQRMRNSIRSFYRRSDQSAPSDPVPAALQSPVRYAAVAADLMFRTLPPR
jgi:uncharacterized protein YceK